MHSCWQTRPGASQSSCRQTRTGAANILADRHVQVQHKALVGRHIQVQHKTLVVRHVRVKHKSSCRQTRMCSTKARVNRHVQVQHRLLQTDSTDGAQAAVGHRPLGTALAAVEQIHAFEAQACSCRPDTSEDITDCCSTDTRTLPGKAQRRDTFKSSTGRHIEETHVPRRHRLLWNRRVQRQHSLSKKRHTSRGSTCF